ncbi:ISAzo13 family transposase [Micromonospora sp. BQ11]|uniref:ISAzo13 family transposase n=1 Tax=Micromonospora sp. BQ11 TaxID=3452212 RepID=UPI003F8A209F
MKTSSREPFLNEFAIVYSAIYDVLDERQRRLLLGATARRLGRGGIKRVAEAVGADPEVVSRGVQQVSSGPVPNGRVRAKGAGRPPVTRALPGVVAALEALMDPVAPGAAESPLRWTTKSTVKLAQTLTAQGFPVGPNTVARLLKECGYALQVGAAAINGRPRQDRDAQFAYAGDMAAQFLAIGHPVISVSARKGRPPGRHREPTDVPGRDMSGVSDDALRSDIGGTTGWVDVRSDPGTAALAVESIRRWWRILGEDAHPGAQRLMIAADTGVPDRSASPAWKAELVRFTDETGLALTLTHLPPGTLRWTNVEHRLFFKIMMNGRGRPPEGHEVVVRAIAATPPTGPRTDEVLHDAGHPAGRITDRRIRDVPHHRIARHAFRGDWNYDIPPAR